MKAKTKEETQKQAADRKQIEDFISAQVTSRGLDGRTEKAYRQDLEHFYLWLNQGQGECVQARAGRDWESKVERYLNYLSRERGLCFSTVTRKYKVLTYYLAYLARQGILPECRLKLPVKAEAERERSREKGPMSRKEIDSLFDAVKEEYENLDSDFRKKVCLRDLVMLELLFYHGIEVSELLRMETSAYERKSGVLVLWGKRGKERRVSVFSRAVREHMEQWIDEREYFERENEYHDRMFLSKLGGPLSMKMVILIFDKYRKLAGIGKAVTPKDLKKSMGRYARELVMEQCG